ncbi:SDR family oxidoreductase [Streptomyces sp. RFCAC02]|uniref:SDR family oxidoreductase n=1 Tax=Streptomyces sp. RFCAC02 TaxID=2499143 RepID=UPI0010207DAA|nr:SDR family oxidoreductase [Streptomyces sp. RFCAC02]
MHTETGTTGTAGRGVVVVTGGGRGIGAATALRLGAAGHALVLGYERDAAAADEVAARVRTAGGAAVTARVDVADEEDVRRLFATAADAGPLTGLVNNAGITGPLGPFAETSPAVMRRVVEVDVLGALLCAREAARAMSTRYGGAGGAIVNVSSGAATLGSPGEYVHYAAAKAALDTLTIGLAKELGPEGVRVNSVQPGLISTGIHAAMGDPGRPARMAPEIPLRRAGEPDEVAAAIAWLLSDEASYTTGAVLRVAGGR